MTAKMEFAFLTAALLALRIDAAPVPHPKVLVARSYDAAVNLYANWPTYNQLPLHPSFPTKAAWGVWGAEDSMGALNHITNKTIKAASSEIKMGRAFNLNLELSVPDPPINPTRRPLIHSFQPESGYFDDIVTMNTQISTQYDGLRHFPYSTDGNISTYQWYNDLISSADEVIGPSPTTVLGIQESAQYGIVGRGLLLDWAGWMDSQGLTFDPFTARAISVAELDATATWQGLNPAKAFKPGDMLFIRTGWVRAYNNLSSYEQQILPFREKDANHIGMLAEDESAEWLWSKKLALVGADNPAFESIPFNGTIGGVPRSLHQVFIGGWGQSIVEFLNFEELATALHAKNRSTFFLTIQNLNLVSGVASPPNAIAIM